MIIGLWIAKIVLSLTFISAGTMTLVIRKENLSNTFPWVNDFPNWSVRPIALAKILSGIGAIVPSLTGILEWLSPVAVCAMCVNMLFAAIYHIYKKEFRALLPIVVLSGIATFIVYQHWGK